MGTLAGGANGGAVATFYAATGRANAPTTNPGDSTNNAAEKRRVEVLKSNKTGDPNAIAVNPLYYSCRILASQEFPFRKNLDL